MVQQVEAFPISFVGRGFTINDSGDYRPGEFKRLHNMELLNDRITSRRDIKALGTSATAIDQTKFYCNKFIGSWNDYAIYAGPYGQVAVNSDGSSVDMWNPGTAFGSEYGFTYSGVYFHRLVGFFKYAYNNYWLEYFQEENTPSVNDDTVGIRIWYSSQTVEDSPGELVFASLNTAPMPYPVSQIVITSGSGPDTEYYSNFAFKNFFMHKDRLWIVTRDKVYFSSVGNPLDFTDSAVPGESDGGSFAIPNSEINYAFGLGDSVYVICDDSIYVYNYTNDPNDIADASMVKITSDFGGYHGCVFRNTPFFVNKEGIYQIDSQYVTKVLDNDFDTGENDFDVQKLTPFREYLVLSKSHAVSEISVDNSLTLYRTNLARNPSFKHSLKAAPLVSHEKYLPLGDIIMSTLFASAPAGLVYSGQVNTDRDTGRLYAKYSNASVFTFRRFNVTFTRGEISSITLDNWYPPNMNRSTIAALGIFKWPNFVVVEVAGGGAEIYMTAAIKEQANSGSNCYVRWRVYKLFFRYDPGGLGSTTQFTSYVNIGNMYTGTYIGGVYANYGADIHVARSPYTYELFVFSSVYDNNRPRNIAVYNTSLTLLSYIGANSAHNALGSDGCFYFGVEYGVDNRLVFVNARRILKMSAEYLDSSNSNGITSSTIIENTTLPNNMYADPDNPMLSGDVSNLNSDSYNYFNTYNAFNPLNVSNPESLCVTNASNKHFAISNYRTSKGSYETLYALVFYRNSLGWVSFSKETITINKGGYWHLRPVKLPEGITSYSLYLSKGSQVNWYLVQDNLNTPTDYYWQGNTPIKDSAGVDITPVGLGALPIPLTTPEYTSPEINKTVNYGTKTETYPITLFGESTNTRHIVENGVLSVYEVVNHRLQGPNRYSVSSDGSFSVPVYGRFALQAGKTYTFSCKCRIQGDFKLGRKFRLSLDVYDSATTGSTPSVTVVKTESNIIAPDLSNSWVTASITISVDIDCYGSIIHKVINSGTNESIFVNAQYDNCIQYKERLIEESSTVNDYFDGDTISPNPTVFYKYTSSPEQWSQSSLSYYLGSDRNLWYPVYDKAKAESSGNTYHTNLVFVNMDSGTVHSVGIDDIPTRECDKIVDVIYNGEDNRLTGYPSLYFLSAGIRFSGYSNNAYAMNYEYSDLPQDNVFLRNSSPSAVSIMPIYLVELDSLTPDLNEYTIKKYRNLEIMGKFPNNLMRMYVAYDDSGYPDLAPTSSTTDTNKMFHIRDKVIGGSNRPHFPHRVGLNQRSRTISLKFTNLLSISDNIPVGVYDKFEISSMRMLWSPTQRAPLSKSNL